MGKLVKILLILGCFGFLGLLGYSYFGDLTSQKIKVTVPVALDGS